MKEEHDPEELKKQLATVNFLAAWLPWAAVILSLLTTSLMILYVFLHK